MRLIDADGINWESVEEEHGARTPAVVACQSLVQNAPTIEAEPVRRGRWLTEYGDHIYAGLRPMFICCSECGMVTAVEWHYCPNCGAKMDGGEERWNK